MRKTNTIALLCLTLLSVFLLSGCGGRLSEEALGLYADGAKNISMEKYEDAVLLFDQALDLEPKFVESYLGKGYALQELEHHDEALLAFDSILSIDDKYIDAYTYKARSLGALEKYPEALASIDKAISLDAQNLQVLSVKGFISYAQGNSQEALAYYDQVLSLDPNFEEALQQKGVILADAADSSSFESSLKYFNQALDARSDSYLNWYNKATILSDLGYTTSDPSYSEQALFHFEKALELNPDYVEARIGQVASLYDMGDYNEALTVVKKTLIDDEELVYGHYYQGLILGELGRSEEAKESFVKVLALDPTHEQSQQELELLGFPFIVEKSKVENSVGG